MTFWVLRRVFRHGRYVMVAIGVALTAFSAALLLPHWNTLGQVWGSDVVDLKTKVSFFFSLYGTIGSSFTTFSRSVLLLTVILLGINMALLIFYIRRRQEASGGRAAQLAGVGGVVSAVLGIGCAACGSVILTAVLSFFGAGGLLLLLPFHGVEFGVLGIVLLLVSIRYLIKRINDPTVCTIK